MPSRPQPRLRRSALTWTGVIVTVASLAIGLLTWVIAKVQLHGEDGGLEDLGTALGNGMVLAAMTVTGTIGLLLWAAGAVRDISSPRAR